MRGGRCRLTALSPALKILLPSLGHGNRERRALHSPGVGEVGKGGRRCALGAGRGGRRGGRGGETFPGSARCRVGGLGVK